jgi:hypothetical protein
VSDFRAENEKKKQNRARFMKQILATEELSVQEASALIMRPVEAKEAPIHRPQNSKPVLALQPT